MEERNGKQDVLQVVEKGALTDAAVAIAGAIGYGLGYGKCYYDNKDKICEKILFHLTVSRKPNYRK